MPYDCPVCGNKEYDEHYGLYFCKECGTQSQELIVQEVEYCSELNPTHEVVVAKKDGQDKFRPKADLGRPWTIYEAYQIIIQAQAEALVKLGAKEELKDVVFTIWANYLSKLGVAFAVTEKIVPNIIEKLRIGRQRELHRGSYDRPLNKSRTLRKANTLKKDITEESGLMEEEHHDEEDFENENDDFIKEFDSSSDGDDPKEKSLNRAARQIKARQSAEWMNLQKTIAICYIGVLYTNPAFLPHDIIRWIHESKIPFLSVANLLPSNMVLSSGDQALFETGKFDTPILLREVNKLGPYLSLTKLPAPTVKELIVRFVKELYLPSEVIDFSFKLVDRIPYVSNDKRAHYSRKDQQAMAYVVLVIRLVFGIDDSTEYLLSDYSSELQKILYPDKMNLFVWTEWKRLCMYKSSEVFDPHRILMCDLSDTKLNHLESLLSSYKSLGMDKKRLTTNLTLNAKKRSVRCFEQQFRDSMKKPLETALERFEILHPLPNERHESSDSECTGKNFVNSTLSHIVNVELFTGSLSDKWKAKETEVLSVISKYVQPKNAISQYTFLKKEEDLVHNRHQNYLWLLQLTSQVLDCKLLDIDKLVVRFTDYLIYASSNDVSDSVCCFRGILKMRSRKKLF